MLKSALSSAYRTIDDAALENALEATIEAAIAQCVTVRAARVDSESGRTMTSAVYSTTEIMAEETELISIGREMVSQGNINAASMAMKNGFNIR